METNTIDLSWLCLVVPIGIIPIAAILGTRSRLRYAKRIKEAQGGGAFDDMNTPKQITRFRWLALIALIGIVGAMGSLMMLILQRFGMISIPAGIIFVFLGAFGILGTIAGYLMQREINHRL
jgi:hypothetical protein